MTGAEQVQGVVPPGEQRDLRALPWLIVALWTAGVLAGVAAEYLISKAFQ